MKRVISLFLALMLCVGILAVPALAVESTTDGLTPEVAAAYLDIVNGLIAQYGLPELSDTSDNLAPNIAYHGMCGGYVVDLGGDAVPELVVAYHEGQGIVKPGETSDEACIEIYTWDGTKAISAGSYVSLFGMRGRSYFILHQSGGNAYFEEKWEWAAGPDEHDYYHLVGNEMVAFAPNIAADETTVELGGKGYIVFNNLDALRALLRGVAGDTVGVTVHGKPVVWTDARPFIDENNRTMVPLRAVAEALEMINEVTWDDAAREAVFFFGAGGSYTRMRFPIGSKTVYWEQSVAEADVYGYGNGILHEERTIEMDTAAVIVNGRTYAPIRYLAEGFGYTVDWNADTRTVVIG